TSAVPRALHSFPTRRSSDLDRQLETMGHVYLDGLSAALLPHVIDNDGDRIRTTLRQALEFHEGVVDQRLTFIDARNRSVIEVLRSEEHTSELQSRENLVCRL